MAIEQARAEFADEPIAMELTPVDETVAEWPTAIEAVPKAEELAPIALEFSASALEPAP